MSVRFAGYAAVFDRPDGGGDIIRRGAFLESLKRAGEVPLLLQHKAGRVLGRIEHLSEDRRGLRVIARLDGGAEGRRVGALLQGGKLDGLSFGYRVREARGGAYRELINLDLVEVSLVCRTAHGSQRTIWTFWNVGSRNDCGSDDLDE